MTRPTDTDWITEGAKVAVVTYQTGTNGERPFSVKPATVAKITASRVTLDSGLKLRRTDLTTVDGGTWRTEWATAMRPNDPRVADARAAIRSRKLARELPAVFAEVRDLGQALEAIDKATDLVAALRAQVVKLAGDAARVAAEGNQHDA